MPASSSLPPVGIGALRLPPEIARMLSLRSVSRRIRFRLDVEPDDQGRGREAEDDRRGQHGGAQLLIVLRLEHGGADVALGAADQPVDGLRELERGLGALVEQSPGIVLRIELQRLAPAERSVAPRYTAGRLRGWPITAALGLASSDCARLSTRASDASRLSPEPASAAGSSAEEADASCSPRPRSRTGDARAARRPDGLHQARPGSRGRRGPHQPARVRTAPTSSSSRSSEG